MSQKRKTEKIKEELRKLAMLPGNKQCMNCQVKGPLYAVIDFNIFVCTFCSAIHRSMQHKVKGITMSEFTDEEVLGLKIGGNERAKRIYRHNFNISLPREGNEREITDLIYRCFVQKIYFNKVEHNKFQRELEDLLNSGFSSVPLQQQVQLHGKNNKAAPVYQASVVQVPSKGVVISDGNNMYSNNINISQKGRTNSISSSSPSTVVTAFTNTVNNVNVTLQPSEVVQQKTNVGMDSAGDFFTSQPISNNNANRIINNDSNTVNNNNNFGTDFFTDIPNNRVPVSAARLQIQRSSYSSCSGSSIIADNNNISSNNDVSNNSSAITALNGIDCGGDFFNNHKPSSSYNWGTTQQPQHQQAIISSQQAAQIQMAPTQFFHADPIQASQHQVTNASNYQEFSVVNNNNNNNNAYLNSNNNAKNTANNFTDFFCSSPSLNQNSNESSKQNTCNNINNDFGFFQSSIDSKNSNISINNSFNNHQQQQSSAESLSKQGQPFQFTSTKPPVLDAFHSLDPLAK